MNKKKILIYSMSVLFATYQVVQGNNFTVAATNEIQNPQEIFSGVCQVEKLYEELMKENPNCVYSEEEWEQKGGRYQYPVTLLDEEWTNYCTTAERYVACQIPKEILTNLSTKELLELVIDFPLLINMYVYNSCEDGIKEIAKYFNGMNELLTRYDCLDVVLEYYKEYKIPEKQNLDYKELLSDDTSKDYNVIVENNTLMKKAQSDAKVMCILNLCEGIIEIAQENGKMSSQEERKATQVIVQKNTQKEASDCVEGISVEYTKEDSLYNTWKQKYKLTSLFNGDNTLLTEKYSANSMDTYGVLYAPGGGAVHYTVHNIWSNISDSTVAGYIKAYSANKLQNKSNAVTCVQNGNTKYDCYNFAWLKDYRRYNDLWKECDFDNDKAFTNSDKYDSIQKAASGWVGSNGIHAVYVVDGEVVYWDKNGNGNRHSEPMVKSKWGTGGPLMKHPLSQCPYVTTGMQYYALI